MASPRPLLPSLLSLLLLPVLLVAESISLTSACEPSCTPTPPSPPPPAPCPPPPSPPPIVYYSPPPPPTYHPPPKHSPTTPPGGGGTPSASLGCCVIIPQGTLYPVDPGYKPSGAAKDDMHGRLAAGGAVMLLTLALWGWW